MDDFIVLKQLFNPGAIVKPDCGEIVLRESKCPASVVKIKMNDMDINDYIVVNLDDNFEVSNIFKGREASLCDFLIIFIKNTQINVVFIELKGTSDTRHKIIDQLTGGWCFWKYCIEILNIFSEARSGSTLYNIKTHYVAFKKTIYGSSKRRTRVKGGTLDNSEPEKFKEISYPHCDGVFLRSLLAR